MLCVLTMLTTTSLHTDLKARLEAIDTKFTLQAHELEHMRERLQHAESGHHKSLMRAGFWRSSRES